MSSRLHCDRRWATTSSNTSGEWRREGHYEYISNLSKKNPQKLSQRLIFRGSRTLAISHKSVSLSGSGRWGEAEEGRPSSTLRPLLCPLALSLKQGRWQEAQLWPCYRSQLMGKRSFLEIWRRYPDGPMCSQCRLSSWSERTYGHRQGHLVQSGGAAVGTLSFIAWSVYSAARIIIWLMDRLAN